MYDLIIKNGKIVDVDRIYEASICVKDGKIAAILDSAIEVEAKEYVDANGNYVYPGVIDTHAHINDPGYTWREDYEHGSAAAAVGGTTTIIDMPLQNEPALTDGKIFDVKKSVASPQSYVDFAFLGGLIGTNNDSVLELDERGCVGFKSFIGPVSPDFVSLNMGQVREVLEILKKVDARAGFHCEDFSIIKAGEAKGKAKENPSWQDFLDSRPLMAEIMATKNIIDLAREIDAKVHICHVSHPAVAEEIRMAQCEGIDVTGETCAHYLTFSEEDVIKNGSLFKCAPPLREVEAVDEMWEYVNDGTLSCVSSDHSPCTLEEKDEAKHGVFGAWGGMSGLQNIMQVAFSEGIDKRGYSPTLITRTMSEGPARAFGIYGKKGAIKVGFDADIVILDPNKDWEITGESLKYVNQISGFVGLKGRGLPVTTIVRGKVVAKDNEVLGEKGFGELVKKIK